MVLKMNKKIVGILPEGDLVNRREIVVVL